ncbi:MAG: sterol desaturase/sphingolipid hydroxylase (fatty acid hydroxylase superfamily) [Bacteriovoracaceae bacterium]|jgi:sterol desaturase/sphingolipid hydroxylase (fatty acid hydroxylase superfamily)
MENAESSRPLIFSIVLIACLIWEIVRPSFKNAYPKRLTANLVLFICGVILLKVCFPFGIYGLAHKLNETQRGFSLSGLPLIFDYIITIILFDFAIYWQHRIMHIFKKLWSFHAVHHSDKAMDFSSAVRFHPGEILFSGVYKILLIVILLPRAETYLVYEIVLSSFALFNHSNIYISKRIDTILRVFVVTPRMHYTHHSPIKKFTNSNYGNFLSIWDKLFKTYKEEDTVVFGLEDINFRDSMSIKELLFAPFKH